MLARGPAPVHRGVILLAGELKPHGSPGLLGEYGRHQIEVVTLVFVPEAAAHEWAHDVDLLRGELQVPGEIRLAIGDALS